MNSIEYRNKIIDTHDFDIEFSNLSKISNEKTKRVEENLKILIKTLYSDIVKTRNESEKKNIQKIEAIFDEQTNELLASIGGLSTVFDKVKALILKEVREGSIDKTLQNDLVESVRKDLQKRLYKYRKSNNKDEEKKIKISISNNLNKEQINQFSKSILQNQTLLKKISDNIKGTIYEQSYKQKKEIVNLLTNNRYRELALKIKKDNIFFAATIIGKQSKLKAFSDIIKLKKTKIGSLKSPKTLLKFFNVKRPKLNRRGFLGLYNQYVYKELIRRVDEFENVVNFKGKMSKTILKGIMKWGGGAIWSGITGIFKLGWNSLMSIKRQIFNITKAVGKMGMSVLKKLKNFIFTPLGMYIIGFFSGIVYKSVIEPIYKKFKAWFNIIFKPIKKWLGYKEDEEIKIEDLREKLAKKIRLEITEGLESGKIQKGIESLDNLQNALEKSDTILRDIRVFIEGGGWKQSVGKAVAGSLSTLGALVGAAFGGPWGALLGGALGGFASSAITYFVDRLPKSSTEKNVILGEIRKMKNKFYQSNSSGSKGLQDKRNIVADKLRVKMSKLENNINSLKNPVDGETKEQTQERLGKLRKTQEEKDRVEGQIREIEGMHTLKENPEDEKQHEIADKILKELEKEENYFEFELSEDWKDGDNNSLEKFWNKAKDSKFEKVENKKNKSGLWANGGYARAVMATKSKENIAKWAMQQSILNYTREQIGFDQILPMAQKYMESFPKNSLITQRQQSTSGPQIGTPALVVAASTKIYKNDSLNETDFKNYSPFFEIDNKWNLTKDKIEKDMLENNKNLPIETILTALQKEYYRLYLSGEQYVEDKIWNEYLGYVSIFQEYGNDKEDNTIEEPKRSGWGQAYEIGFIRPAQAIVTRFKEEEGKLLEQEWEKYRKQIVGVNDKDVLKEVKENQDLSKIKEQKKLERNRLKEQKEQKQKDAEKLRDEWLKKKNMKRVEKGKVENPSVFVIPVEVEKDDIDSANETKGNVFGSRMLNSIGW